MIVIAREIDQWLMIGRDVFVSPTDIDRSVHLIARGRMLGGPDDGATFESTHDLGRGQWFHIGPHVTVGVMEILKDCVRLGVVCPPNVPVMRKEIYDKLARERERGEGSEAED